jgi:general secretion pathway protein J
MYGFTLIEILISLFILSIIGAIITSGFNLVVKTQAQVSKKNEALSEIQLTMAIMEQDFQQIIDRPIHDENGIIQPALLISESRIEFTRSGFINPYSLNKRSTLQRVAYQVENSSLIRYTWPALDRDVNTLPDRQILLNHVKYLALQVLQPPKTKDSKGISIEMEVTGVGYVKRVIAIPTTSFEISYGS